MKNERGITLGSLIIYVIVTMMAIAILATIMASFTRDVKDISKSNTDNLELDKFYSYFLKDVKNSNNDISEIAENNQSITFTSGNEYSFSNQAIFYNDNIKLAENIEACTFDEGEENGKTTITTAITINGTTYTRKFVLGNSTTIAQVNEEDYVHHELPPEYQRVEYLESKGAQYIDSGTHLTLDTIIQCKFVYTATGSGYPTPYGCIQPSFGLYSNGGNGATVYTSFGSNYDVTYTGNLLDGPKTFIQNKDGVWVDGIKKVTYTNTTVTEDPNVHIYLFARMGNGTAAKFSKARLYSFSILHGNNTVRNFVPCIRKTDSKPGLYDTVAGTFYTDAGTSGVDFDVGPDI